MAPDKMTITPQGREAIKVMFNPNTYTIRKEVAWNPAPLTTAAGATTDAKTNAPPSSFAGGGRRTLDLELFFDVTESSDDKKDVRTQTDEIVRLTRIDGGNGHPPVCTVQWGENTTEDFPFVGTVSQLTQRFTLFDKSGRPLRATLNVTFVEWLRRSREPKTDPEMTTRTLRLGDSLASVAAEVYRDPAQWRVIAAANRIEDPLRVSAGLKLTLPKP